VFSVPLLKLLEGGARVDIKNKEGKAPIDVLPNLLEPDRSLTQLVKALNERSNEGQLKLESD
jgi:hypothetical protein